MRGNLELKAVSPARTLYIGFRLRSKGAVEGTLIAAWTLHTNLIDQSDSFESVQASVMTRIILKCLLKATTTDEIRQTEQGSAKRLA